MRRLILALPVLLLAGCGGSSTDFISEVQERAVKLCGFMPIASTVAGVADAMGAGGTATAGVAVAKAICDAVMKPQVNTLLQAPREGPKAEGVPVEGCFVEGEEKCFSEEE